MIDIKFLKDNVELVKQAVKNKNEKADIDKILEIDEQKRKVQFNFDQLRARQNQVSKEIAKIKKQKGDASELLTEMKDVAKQVKDLNQELSDLESVLYNAVLEVPNVPDECVPVGKDEASNAYVREWSEKKSFDFKPKTHEELSEKLLDFQRGGKLTGSGFPVYTKYGALLERALINFMLDTHVYKNDYTEVKTPFIVNRKTMTGTGQLPKLENDMYHINEDDLFLIPTAEVPVTNLHADEICQNTMLPVKYVSYTPCFRREAGSYGKDTKGLQRVHQFNKVEMVRFVRPEESEAALEEMVVNAEKLLQDLGLHYRVIELCTGDLSFASARTFDIEVWAPGSEKYLEVSSVSNFRDFQARRAGIRFRDADNNVKFVHTLNGSGLATPRTFIALIETWQQEDGSIVIPEKLKPYMQGIEKLEFS